jgi:hypothetical protein
VTQAPDKSGSAVTAAAAAAEGADEATPARPWQALGTDRREETAVLRARRFGLGLMAVSSIAMIALLLAAWLLLHSLF